MLEEVLSLLQEYSFTLADLPKSYVDPQWQEIRDLCDLTLPEVALLQREAMHIGSPSKLNPHSHNIIF